LPCQNAATLAARNSLHNFSRAGRGILFASRAKHSAYFQRLFFTIRRFPAVSHDVRNRTPVVKNATGQAQKILYRRVALLQ
jgi:hypothetical protein